MDRSGAPRRRCRFRRAESLILHALRSLPSAARPSQPPTFREARDLLLQLSDDYHAARAAFSWPRPERFNWALDWFDAELAAGEHGHTDRAHGDRRSRRDKELRRAFAGVLAPRRRPSRARGQARRPALDDAGRMSRTVGDDARGDEARPRAHPRDAATGRLPTSPTGSSAARPNISSRMAATPRNSPGSSRKSSASPSARRRKAGGATKRS